MASLPLVSCFCMPSSLCGGGQAEHPDAPRFGTDEETDAAPGAPHARVDRRTVPVVVEPFRQVQYFGWTGLHAKPATLTFFGVHLNRTTVGFAIHRSEERRVGKECRSRWSP